MKESPFKIREMLVWVYEKNIIIKEPSVLGISKPQRTSGSHERTSNFLHFKILKKLEL
jgi:hypothetical protein